MSYILFCSIVAIVLGIQIVIIGGDIFELISVLLGCLLVGVLIFSLSVETVNLRNIKESISVVVKASEGMTDSELDEEVERIIRDEVNDRFFDSYIDIQNSNVSGLNIKRINIKTKSPVITKLLYQSYEYSFKVFVQILDSGEYNVEIVGI